MSGVRSAPEESGQTLGMQGLLGTLQSLFSGETFGNRKVA